MSHTRRGIDKVTAQAREGGLRAGLICNLNLSHRFRWGYLRRLRYGSLVDGDFSGALRREKCGGDFNYGEFEAADTAPGRAVSGPVLAEPKLLSTGRGLHWSGYPR